jgi:hypothetical protein
MSKCYHSVLHGMLRERTLHKNQEYLNRECTLGNVSVDINSLIITNVAPY